MTRRLVAVGLWLAFAGAGCTGSQGGDAQLDGAISDVIDGSDIGAMDSNPMDHVTADSPPADGSDAAPPGDATDLVVPSDGTDVQPGADAQPTDGGGDAADDGGTLTDIPAFDIYDVIGTFDGGSLDDAPTPSTCDAVVGLPTICTMDSDCLRAEICLPSGCGTTMRCQPRGRPCLVSTDCLWSVQTCFHGVCAPTATECGDSRACPLGYTCEGAAGSTHCVDRRHTCDGTFTECPYNSICYYQNGLAPFCLGITTHCSSNATCVYSTCEDMDGEGQGECAIVGSCTGATTCASTFAGNTCEILPIEARTSCGPHGYCSATRPCPSGYDCLDVWGNGVRECRPSSDPCHTHADCPSGQLCYTTVTDDGAPGTSGCH